MDSTDDHEDGGNSNSSNVCEWHRRIRIKGGIIERKTPRLKERKKNSTVKKALEHKDCITVLGAGKKNVGK